MGGDWPQHLGPARNGLYADSDFAWNSGGLRVAWQMDVGSGFAAPAVSGGKLILFHRRGGKEIVDAFDAKSGRAAWTSEYKTGYRDDFGFDDGPRAAPCVAGNVVFTHGAEGTLSATSMSGKRLWQRAAMKEFHAPKGFFGAACSPLVYDGKVLLSVGGPDNAGIVAFDAATGKTVWQATADEAGYSSPVVAPLGGQPRAIFFTRAGLVVLDPATGKVMTKLAWRARSNASVNAATPIVSGAQVFLTSSYGTGAILVDLSSGQPKPIWQNDDSMSCHYGTPVLKDGFLYGYHGRQETGAELRCVEWKTGKVRWTNDKFGAGSVVLVGGRLLLVREQGQVVLAEANAGGYKSLAMHKAFEATVRAYPAIGSGLLFIRSEKRLVALAP
ncbi:MAG: alcohol dehydrogenase [Acidobacteria bacterium]|nr:alcohol dehydrogenase [Acidobacteriota bacterium]